jgi:hypothetical protein
VAFKDNISIMCETMKVIVNKSFSSGEFPNILREAVICPVLKKPTLDKNMLQKYRPVSNIRYYSKIIKKIASVQLQEHLQFHGLQEEFQSAYRTKHSTETALLRVKSDITTEMDCGRAVLVVLLDLSAAFDTIDHDILLNRLSDSFNITGMALQWIKTYLQGRKVCVSVDAVPSDKYDLKFGIPQGSVLGPLFFVLYTYCIGPIIQKHGIRYHIYADDVQLYLSFDPKTANATDLAISRLSSCIGDIRGWMKRNMLKLNDSKTEFFIAASSHNLLKLQDVTIKIGNAEIRPSPTIKNLGVVFDQTMSMKNHVQSLSKTLNFYLRSIYRIRKYITVETCHHLARALILSRLDYSNSLLTGISAQDRKRLQRLQIRAAIITFL